MGSIDNWAMGQPKVSVNGRRRKLEVIGTDEEVGQMQLQNGNSSYWRMSVHYD